MNVNWGSAHGSPHTPKNRRSGALIARPTGPGGSSQRGVGLIEVLIAVLILGIGLMGVAAMQATALRNSQSSLERSHAVIQSYAILDAMRANRDAANKGAYDIEMLTTCMVSDDGSLAKADINYWFESLKAALGEEACGSIVRAGGNTFITVQWNDSRGVHGDSSQKITTSAQL